MKISRRIFLGGASTACLLAVQPQLAKGWIHGSGSPLGQTVINLSGNQSTAFANFAKYLSAPSGISTNLPLSLNSSGFPANGTYASNLQWGLSVDPTYYGRFYIWWVGTLGMILQGAPVMIYSGGSSIPGNGSNPTATSGNNLGIGGAANTNPTSGNPLEFAWGALISAVGASGGLIQFTTPYTTSLATGNQGVFNNLTYNGGAFPTGPNVDGSWTITATSTTTFTLQGSGSLNSALIGITSSGGPGTQTEIVTNGVVAAGMQVSSGTAISGWTDFVYCKKADGANIIAGKYASISIVNALKALAPRFVRVMDLMAVQGDRSTGYGPKGTASYNVQPGMMNWILGGYQVQDYYTSSTSIANTGVSGSFSDLYTCNSPTASPTVGAYQEGEIVCGQFGSSAVNTGVTPALNVNSRGAAPIFLYTANMYNAFWSGTPPTSGTVTMTISGAGLSSSKVFTTTADTFQNMWFAFQTQINGDATCQSLGIISGNTQEVSNSQGGFFFCPNVTFSGSVIASLNGANFSVAITGGTGGSPTYSFGAVGVGQLANSSYATFTYNKRMGGWICLRDGATVSGPRAGPPLAFYSDLVNRVGCGLYMTVGQLWSDQRIFDTAKFMGQAGVRELLIELSNETWNAFAQEWNFAQVQGSCLGVTASTQEQWIALRTIQIAAQAASGWAAAGRSRSQLFISICGQLGFTSSGSVPYKLNGTGLNAVSPTGPGVALAAYGGYGATSISTNYTAAPNRPVDFADCIGAAPYFGGLMLNMGNGDNTSPFTNCPLASYNALLLAAYNFQYGNSTQQNAALSTLYSGGSTGTGDLYGNTSGGFLRCTFTATVSGTALTSSSVSPSGALSVLDYVNIPGVPANTYIVSGSGSSWTLSASGSASGASASAYSFASNPANAFQFNSCQTPFLYNSGDTATSQTSAYYQIGVVAASYDSGRLSLPAGQVGQTKLGVVNYEGGWGFGPASISPHSDITNFATALTTLGYTNGYSSGLPGAAAGGPTGASDTAALAAQNIWILLNGNYGNIAGVAQTTTCFKNDSRCYDLVNRYLSEQIAAGKNGALDRVSCAAWYGWLGNTVNTPNWWSLYLSGGIGQAPCQAFNALKVYG